MFGHLNQAYPFRILGEGVAEGSNTRYKVELLGISTGVPAERLLPGERFSVEYAPVERTLSRKVGTVRFTSPVSMRNTWTYIRKHYKMPGNMMNKQLAFGIPMVHKDASGKQVKDVSPKWIH